MDETNLLSLIRTWLDNIYQITTKTVQYPFAKKFCIQTGLKKTRDSLTVLGASRCQLPRGTARHRSYDASAASTPRAGGRGWLYSNGLDLDCSDRSPSIVSSLKPEAWTEPRARMFVARLAPTLRSIRSLLNQGLLGCDREQRAWRVMCVTRTTEVSSQTSSAFLHEPKACTEPLNEQRLSFSTLGSCLVHSKMQKVFKIPHHIAYAGICTDH
jgi:hypothetical protein